MKHTMLTLGLAGLLAASLPAQEAMPAAAQQNAKRQSLTPAEKAKKDADRAAQKLALSEEQKAKWESAALERSTANQPLKQKIQGSTTPQERKELHLQMQANTEKFNSTVMAMLSPEQKTKYEQMQKERKAHMRKGKKQGDMTGTPD